MALNQELQKLTSLEEIEELVKFMSTSEMMNLDIGDSKEKALMVYQVFRDHKNRSFPGHKLTLSTEPFWALVYKPTFEQNIKTQRQKLFSIKGEDSRDFSAMLKDFHQNNVKRKEAYKLATDIVKTAKTNLTCSDKDRKTNVGLYIHSKEYQIGKTFLANAITNELADLGIGGVFVFAPSLASQAKKFENLENMMRDLKDAPVLVIDDIGAEYRSEWFRIEVLMPVLQNRLSNNKLTIFTSNYSTAALETLYARNNNPVDAQRLISRILELCNEIELSEK